LTAAVTASALEALSHPHHYCLHPHELVQAEKIMMVIVMHISPLAPGRESGICKGNTVKNLPLDTTLLYYKSPLLFSSGTATLVEYSENH